MIVARLCVCVCVCAYVSVSENRKTYLPNYVHREGSDKKITMTTIVHKMFGFPEEQERWYRSHCHSDANGEFIAS